MIVDWRSPGAVAVSIPSRSYAVRDAGSPSRLGKVYKTYPYMLDALLEVLEEARLRSFNEGPQVVTVVTGRSDRQRRERPRRATRTPVQARARRSSEGSAGTREQIGGYFRLNPAQPRRPCRRVSHKAGRWPDFG